MPVILLAGATGLIGSMVAGLIAAGEDPLHILSRRTTGQRGAQVAEHVAPTEDWPAIISTLRPAILISTLGTTWRKAGSEAAFRAVDQALVLALARAAKSAGARQMIFISSAGADAESRALYLHVKGEVEQALQTMCFDRLDVIRPGLLRGARTEWRRGERIAIALSPLTDALLHGRLRRYRAIGADRVARAIVALTQVRTPGLFIHHNDDIRRIAG